MSGRMHVRVSRSKPDERAPPARKFWHFIEQHRIKTTQKRKIIYWNRMQGVSRPPGWLILVPGRDLLVGRDQHRVIVCVMEGSRCFRVERC